MTDQTPRNREQWLMDFAALAIPYMKARHPQLSLGEGKLKLSCGFPSRGGTARKRKTVGQHFHYASLGRKTHEVFVHPALSDAVEVGETVIHEIIHAMLPPGAGHRKPFSQASKAVGLEGPPTKNVAGDELKQFIAQVVEQIGPYPHESLDAGGGPKQTTRLLKAMCPICGYIVRVTSKWIDEAGPPICPQCMTGMIEAGTDEVGSMPLVSAEQHVVYQVKRADRKPGDKNPWDERWFIQMHRRGTERPKFTVIDYGPPLADDEVAVKGEDGSLRVEKKARLIEFEPPNPSQAADWVLGDVSKRLKVSKDGVTAVESDDEVTLMSFPRYTPAKSRDDAIGLMESLRDGSMNYDDIDQSEDTGEDIDDPYFLDEEEEEWRDTNVPRAPGKEASVERAEDDPRFPWEIEAGIDPDEINPEAERIKREAWVSGDQTKNPTASGPLTEEELTDRIKHLESLSKPRKRGGRR